MAVAIIHIFFLFALGACVGSFLNVVVWRLPRNESLVSPPSHCPYCDHRLAWYDNIPVFGWLALRGRCRYCFNPISIRYPLIEFISGALFALYYIVFFLLQRGPCAMRPLTVELDWPILAIDLFAIACLLAASLIDLANYWIPLEIPILMTFAGLLYHAIHGRNEMGLQSPGTLSVDSNGVAGPLALGAGIGLLISLSLLFTGLLKSSFADGYPELEIDQLDEAERSKPGWMSVQVERLVNAFRAKLTPEQEATRKRFANSADERDRRSGEEAKNNLPAQPPAKEFSKADVRREMRHEMLFLMFPMVGSIVALLLVQHSSTAARMWQALIAHGWVSGLLGSLFGAMVGALIIWMTRIIGTVIVGREAMGLGDVHLMFGIGAIQGAGAATVTFFIAPFFGIAVAIYLLLTSTRREVPYGPYLGMAAAFTMMFYCPIAAAMAPGLLGAIEILRARMGS